MEPGFWKGVIVTLVVGLFVNLITPATRNFLLSFLSQLTDKLKIFNTWSKKKALSSTQNELARLENYYSSPVSFVADSITVIGLNIILIFAFTVVLFVTSFFSISVHQNVKFAFAGALGVGLSTFMRLLIIVSIAQKLKQFDEYKLKLLERIEKFKK